MNRYFRYTFGEFLRDLRQLLTEFWWITCPIIFCLMSYFVENEDMSNRLITLGLLFPTAKAIWELIQLNEEAKIARENEQYKNEPEHSIGPPNNIYDIPTFKRRKNKNPDLPN
jgi:hypothetical protein